MVQNAAIMANLVLGIVAISIGASALWQIRRMHRQLELMQHRLVSLRKSDSKGTDSTIHRIHELFGAYYRVAPTARPATTVGDSIADRTLATAGRPAGQALGYPPNHDETAAETHRRLPEGHDE